MSSANEAGKRAFAYHKSGLNCAEAVLKAIVETYGMAAGPEVPGVATAFGGGIGRTHQDICGAISGGIIAIGYLCGRNTPGADWSDASEMAAELRDGFIDVHATTNCGDLLSAFGSQDNMMRCKQLSGEVAAMLAKIIENRRPKTAAAG